MEALFQNLPGIQLSLPVVLFAFLILGILTLGLFLDVALLVYWIVRPPDWAAILNRLRSNPWKPADGLGVLALCGTLIIYSLLTLLADARPMAPQPATPVPVYAVVIQALFFPTLALGLVSWLLYRRKLSLHAAFSTTSPGLGKAFVQALICYLAAMPILLIASLLYQLLLSAVDYHAPRQEIVLWMADPANPVGLKIFMAGMAVLVAPVIEETLFRGILLPSLSHHVRIWLAVAFVSIFFASIHLNVPSVIPLATIATAFAFGYIYTGSILVPIMAHAIFNGVTILALIALPPEFITAAFLF